MSGNLKPLDLILRGVDRYSGQFADMNRRVTAMQAPVVKLSGSFARLAQEAKLPAVGAALRGVGVQVAALGRLAGGLALGGGIFGVSVATGMSRFIDYTANLAATAGRLDVTTDKLQELRFAADQIANVPADQFDHSMKVFSKSMTEMAAHRGMAFQVAQRLEQISGIKIIDPAGANALPDVLNRTADAMKKVENPAAAMRMAMILTGNANEEMVTFLQSGSATLEEYGRIAHATAQILDNDLVKAGAAAEDEFGTLHGALRTMGFTVMGELLPAIREITKGFQTWLQDPANRTWIREELGPQLRELVSGLATVGRAIGWVVNAMGGMRNAAILASAWIGRGLIGSVLQLGWALVGPTLRGAWMLSTGIMKLSGVLVTVGRVALPVVVAAIRMMGVAFAASPIGAFILAVNVLIGLGTLLYFKWKPFRDMIDGIVESVKYAASYWTGGESGDAAAAASASASPSAAMIGRGGGARIGGRVDVMVGAEAGTRAQVTNVQSVNRDVPVTAGPIMSGAY